MSLEALCFFFLIQPLVTPKETQFSQTKEINKTNYDMINVVRSILVNSGMIITLISTLKYRGFIQQYHQSKSL